MWLQIQGDPTQVEEALRWWNLVSKEKRFHGRGLRTAQAMAPPPKEAHGWIRACRGIGREPLRYQEVPAQRRTRPGPSHGQ